VITPPHQDQNSAKGMDKPTAWKQVKILVAEKVWFTDDLSLSVETDGKQKHNSRIWMI
jgi:hypothetical protein